MKNPHLVFFDWFFSQIPIEDEDGTQSRVDCWMEITKGRFPHTTDIDGAVKVGSPLTLAIFVKDPRKRTDIRVKDCYGKLISERFLSERFSFFN